MELFGFFITFLGLCLFEIISSIDNAVINAEVINTMSAKARRWFLFYGLIFAVFIVRGVLPWLIVYAINPSLGVVGSLTATFSSDKAVIDSIELSKPILLMGGGIFLLFLFLHWIFLETKNYGLKVEKYIEYAGVWFFAVVSILLAVVVWFALKINPLMAFGAVVGSTAFFITHGFKQNAEDAERKLVKGNLSDVSKILYLEVIDMTFSIDGVLGAFAFTMSVPLILIGNGVGAFVVREITIKYADKVKKYVYLKNGAMYSILGLGTIMVLEAFGLHIPSYVSPLLTFLIVGLFFYKSYKDVGK